MIEEERNWFEEPVTDPAEPDPTPIYDAVIAADEQGGAE